MSARVVLIVCASSVTRALFASLLGSTGDEVHPFDTLPRGLAGMMGKTPDVVIVEAAIVRAHPEALERLRQAWDEPVGIILADRAYADERRGAEECRAVGATAYVAIPPEAGALSEAVRRAVGDSTRASVSTPPQEIAEAVESSPPASAEQMARYVERLWSRLETLDAYQLLRVASDASTEEIRSAFRERALEFHPDRLHAGLDETSRERIYQVFKRISWAFRKVGDPKARREYETLRRPRPA